MIPIEWMKILLLDFGIQWCGFVIAYTFKTEYFYDLLGSLTYTTILASIAYKKYLSTSQVIQFSLVAIWATRLGSYLFMRMLKQGEDKRFRIIKTNAIRFFTVWNLQALWIIVTLYPSIKMALKPEIIPIKSTNIIGWSIFAIGFVIEAVSDQQKWNFKANIDNRDNFISYGLWKYSRHPNYFGEILLWSGLYLSTFSHIVSFKNRLIASISPVFLAFLLIKISGVPLLEISADKRWGARSDYQEYKRNTACLIPFIW